MNNVLDNVRDAVINVRLSLQGSVRRHVWNVRDPVERNVEQNVHHHVLDYTQELLQGDLV